MQFCKGEANVGKFREALQPSRDVLKDYQYLGGTSPCYADMYLMGIFMVCCLHVLLRWRVSA